MFAAIKRLADDINRTYCHELLERSIVIHCPHNNLMYETFLSHSFSHVFFFVKKGKLFVTLICAMSPSKESLKRQTYLTAAP